MSADQQEFISEYGSVLVYDYHPWLFEVNVLLAAWESNEANEFVLERLGAILSPELRLKSLVEQFIAFICSPARDARRASAQQCTDHALALSGRSLDDFTAITAAAPLDCVGPAMSLRLAARRTSRYVDFHDTIWDDILYPWITSGDSNLTGLRVRIGDFLVQDASCWPWTTITALCELVRTSRTGRHHALEVLRILRLQHYELCRLESADTAPQLATAPRTARPKRPSSKKSAKTRATKGRVASSEVSASASRRFDPLSSHRPSAVRRAASSSASVPDLDNRQHTSFQTEILVSNGHYDPTQLLVQSAGAIGNAGAPVVPWPMDAAQYSMTNGDWASSSTHAQFDILEPMETSDSFDLSVDHVPVIGAASIANAWTGWPLELELSSELIPYDEICEPHLLASAMQSNWTALPSGPGACNLQFADFDMGQPSQIQAPYASADDVSTELSSHDQSTNPFTDTAPSTSSASSFAVEGQPDDIAKRGPDPSLDQLSGVQTRVALTSVDSRRATLLQPGETPEDGAVPAPYTDGWDMELELVINPVLGASWSSPSSPNHPTPALPSVFQDSQALITDSDWLPGSTLSSPNTILPDASPIDTPATSMCRAPHPPVPLRATANRSRALDTLSQLLDALPTVPTPLPATTRAFPQAILDQRVAYEQGSMAQREEIQASIVRRVSQRHDLDGGTLCEQLLGLDALRIALQSRAVQLGRLLDSSAQSIETLPVMPRVPADYHAAEFVFDGRMPPELRHYREQADAWNEAAHRWFKTNAQLAERWSRVYRERMQELNEEEKLALRKRFERDVLPALDGNVLNDRSAPPPNVRPSTVNGHAFLPHHELLLGEQTVMISNVDWAYDRLPSQACEVDPSRATLLPQMAAAGQLYACAVSRPPDQPFSLASCIADSSLIAWYDLRDDDFEPCDSDRHSANSFRASAALKSCMEDALSQDVKRCIEWRRHHDRFKPEYPADIIGKAEALGRMLTSVGVPRDLLRDHMEAWQVLLRSLQGWSRYRSIVDMLICDHARYTTEIATGRRRGADSADMLDSRQVRHEVLGLYVRTWYEFELFGQLNIPVWLIIVVPVTWVALGRPMRIISPPAWIASRHASVSTAADERSSQDLLDLVEVDASPADGLNDEDAPRHATKRQSDGRPPPQCLAVSSGPTRTSTDADSINAKRYWDPLKRQWTTADVISAIPFERLSSNDDQPFCSRELWAHLLARKDDLLSRQRHYRLANCPTHPIPAQLADEGVEIRRAMPAPNLVYPASGKINSLAENVVVKITPAIARNVVRRPIDKCGFQQNQWRHFLRNSKMDDFRNWQWRPELTEEYCSRIGWPFKMPSDFGAGTILVPAPTASPYDSSMPYVAISPTSLVSKSSAPISTPSPTSGNAISPVPLRTLTPALVPSEAMVDAALHRTLSDNSTNGIGPCPQKPPGIFATSTQMQFLVGNRQGLAHRIITPACTGHFPCFVEAAPAGSCRLERESARVLYQPRFWMTLESGAERPASDFRFLHQRAPFVAEDPFFDFVAITSEVGLALAQDGRDTWVSYNDALIFICDAYAHRQGALADGEQLFARRVRLFSAVDSCTPDRVLHNVRVWHHWQRCAAPPPQHANEVGCRLKITRANEKYSGQHRMISRNAKLVVQYAEKDFSAPSFAHVAVAPARDLSYAGALLPPFEFASRIDRKAKWLDPIEEGSVTKWGHYLMYFYVSLLSFEATLRAVHPDCQRLNGRSPAERLRDWQLFWAADTPEPNLNVPPLVCRDRTENVEGRRQRVVSFSQIVARWPRVQLPQPPSQEEGDDAFFRFESRVWVAYGQTWLDYVRRFPPFPLPLPRPIPARFMNKPSDLSM